MARRLDNPAETRTRSLTRDAVAAATLDLIDLYGLRAATMRAIANRLGVRAQSLYSHVSSREDLLDAVAERVVSEVDIDLEVQRDPASTWQFTLAATAHSVRRYAHRHPGAFILVATRPAQPPRPEPALLPQRWVADLLTNLKRSGFDDDAVTFAYRAFDAFLLGSLLLETRDLAIEPTAAAQTWLQVDPTRTPTTARLRNPAAAAALAHDDDFTADLDDVINRITTHVALSMRPTVA